ncbi:MAG: hypothetical protein Tsb0016_03650 [Sphingomonadales bacterium]
MRLKKTAGQRLVFVDRPWFLPGVLFIAGIGLAFALWQHWQGGAAWSTGDIALAFGAGVLLAMAVLFSDHSRFVFDLKRGQLRWRSESFWRLRDGTLKLEDVHGLRLECAAGEAAASACRGVIDTRQGPLPMSRRFRGQKQDWEGMLAEIEAFAGSRFGKPADTH